MSADFDSLDLDEILSRAPSLLQDENTSVMTARSLARRLQSHSLDEFGTRAVIRMLCAHYPSDPTLLSLFLELLQTIPSPLPVINSISVAAVSATPAQIQLVLDEYRQLLQADRQLLVPIIGSIAELQLSPQQKLSYEALVRGSLTMVDETDIPTVVQALLNLACPANSSEILAAIREEAASLAMASVYLLVEPCVTALRTKAYCSKAFWLLLSTSTLLTPLDVLIVGQLLQQWAHRHEAANAILSAMEEDAIALTTLERTLKQAQPPAAFAYVRLALQLALIPTSTAASKAATSARRLRQRDKQLVSGLISAVSRAAFTHSSLRHPTITALLSACAHTDTGAAGSGGVGMCARLAARTVLELATKGVGDEVQGWGHLVLHFLMQHAALCHVSVMQLLASAAVAIAERQSRGLSDILLLVQKLVCSTHVEQQRAGLILSGHVLRSRAAEKADADMVLTGMSRMPFRPSWPAAEHLYRAVMHGTSSLPPQALASLLSDHVRPAALAAGLVAQETSAAPPTKYVLTIDAYVRRSMSSSVRAASGACELLRCLLLLEGGMSIQTYAAAACEWDVQMHGRLWEDLGQPSAQGLATAMLVGLCCWLNARLGVMCANTHVAAMVGKKSLPRCVLARVLQAMACAQRLFGVVQPYMQQCVKAAAKGGKEGAGGPILQELLALVPHTIGASLRLLCRVLATIQPVSTNLPAVTQMVDLLEGDLEAAFGCEEADERGEWVTVEAVEEPWRSGVTPNDRLTACVQELLSSGMLTWLAAQATHCADEASLARTRVVHASSEGAVNGNQVHDVGADDQDEGQGWRGWLQLARGVYAVLLRVIEKLNATPEASHPLWVQVASALLGTAGKQVAQGGTCLGDQLFDKLHPYGIKLADGGVASLHVALMRAIMWRSDRKGEVGLLAAHLAATVFPSEDILSLARLPRAHGWLGPRETTISFYKEASCAHAKFLVATALATLEPYDERLAWANKVLDVVDKGQGQPGDGGFGMLMAATARDFVSPIMLLVRAAAMRGLPPVTGRTPEACVTHVREVRKGLKLAVRLMRGGLGKGASLLAVHAGQLHLVRFGSRLAKGLRQSVPALLRVCAGVEGAGEELAEEVSGVIRDATEIVEALRGVAARIAAAGGGKAADKLVAGTRLCADLLFASLRERASASLSAITQHIAANESSDMSDSDQDDETTASRFYALRSGGKRKRAGAQAQGQEGEEKSDGSDSDEEVEEQEEAVDEPSTVIINFKKKT